MHLPKHSLIASLLTFYLACATTWSEVPPAWKAAAASVVITPETNMPMAGYASRNKPSEGTAQDLFAKALALEDAAGSRFVIVTMDLIGVPRDLREHLEKRVSEACALPPERLLLNASHTHCGPEFRAGRTLADGASDSSKPGEIYGGQLEEKLLTLIGTALKGLAPAQLTYSHGRAGFSMNRRLPTDTGFQNSPYPDGPVDQDVPVLIVRDPGKNIRAVLFGYCCHNTTLSFYQFCGDYAGYAQEYLQADHPGITALFLNGCSGDQNPYPRSTVELSEQHGRTLATAVEAALLPAPLVLAPKLATSLELCPLAFAPLPSEDVLQQRAKSSNVYERTHAENVLETLKANDGKLPEYGYAVQVIKLGGKLTLVALADEIVVDYSLRTKRELKSQTDPVWVAGYSNIVTCYVPSERVLKEGGYEAGGAMIYTSLPGPFVDDVEERVFESIHRQWQKLPK